MDDLRSSMLNMRKSQNESDWIKNSESTSQLLMKLPEINNSKIIGFYSSIQGEVDTTIMIDELIKMGKTICLPKINTSNKTINFFQIQEIENLVKGHYGILEPNTNIEISPRNLQCVIVPGIAFDDFGNRLGYGYGYYDKFFTNNNQIIKIGIGFDFQILSEIKSKSLDVKIDVLVTESRIIYF